MPFARAKIVHRPVWRTFLLKFLDRAVLHVRAGGFAVLVGPEGPHKMLLPRREPSGLTEMARWALLAIDIRRWGTIRTGVARGLASVRVLRRDRDILREWCERDSVHARARYALALDCLRCGACCRDNRVVLEASDLARWRRFRRPELTMKPYVHTNRGTKLLCLASNGHCLHLGEDLRCAIYRLRPNNCRAFVVGSEPCLAARLETLGIVD